MKKQEVNTEKQNLVEIHNSTITNPAFPMKDILGIWAEDLSGPHADFELTESYFYVVDYDGNGHMPYEINTNKIKIYFPDSEQMGLIKKAKNDSLVIYCANGEFTTYLRWTK
ncbi:hypothetical protein J2X31_001761 [Flavobacterium arsenatis]|uniref:Lipocalin-like domain-containing protein n=1 Tax=Flavobacterium arsenatis TaxID=1484332 RepID=A0ABU1TP54_9FLAO|nr:hypothetical protein [Flavobacterium arsenatis]MDR6967749.1 hypothetical protein [Flavobacterium arsenatis]